VKKKTKKDKFDKQFENIEKNISKLKEKSLLLWTNINLWNKKNNSKLRPFEDFLLSKLINDLRVIQSEHFPIMKAMLEEKNEKSK
jgi:sulfatase maturation enzyme AslB (radical SAM superfamily)